MWCIYIYFGILHSHKKRCVCVICRDLDESGNHYSQQTDIRTESQTLHVLTHRWVLNNENTWTQGEEQHILGAVEASRGETVGGGEHGEG